MKPSHLAALMLTAISGGLIGGQSAQAQTELVIKRDAVTPTSHGMDLLYRYLMSAPVGIEHHPASWRKLNQRQLRRNRRRANAAGARNAFA